MRVNCAIADGSLARSPVLRAAFARGRRVHLLGLVSHGGVHSHIDHLRALLELAPDKTWIHAFTDGRDVSPHSAIPTSRRCRRTASRRRRALLRDGPRQPRSSEPEGAATRSCSARAGHAPRAPLEAVRASYEAGITDEFIEPVVIDGTPRIEPGDTAIFFNFRPDRGAPALAARCSPPAST